MIMEKSLYTFPEIRALKKLGSVLGSALRVSLVCFLMSQAAPFVAAASSNIGLRIRILPSPQAALSAAAEGKAPIVRAVKDSCRQLLSSGPRGSLDRRSVERIVDLAGRSGVVLVGDRVLLLSERGSESVRATSSDGSVEYISF